MNKYKFPYIILMLHLVSFLNADIALKPITSEQYPAFYQMVLQSGTHDLMGAGYDQITAQAGMNDELGELLPNEMHSLNQFLYAISDEEIRIGYVWYEITGDSAWLYFLGFDEQFQGRGYGSRVIKLVENHCAQQAINSIGLNVFALNARAISLYKKAGFFVKSSFCKPDSQIIWRYEMRKVIGH